MTFIYKTYRCEWQLQTVNVDQYGQTMSVESYISYPTRAEAEAAREVYAVPNRHAMRWHPKDAAGKAVNDYQQVDIVYREVEVKEK